MFGLCKNKTNNNNTKVNMSKKYIINILLTLSNNPTTSGDFAKWWAKKCARTRGYGRRGLFAMQIVCYAGDYLRRRIF
jgi:hypothetical protein